MGDLYDKINSDLKQAMINKDHKQISVLKLLKSSMLYMALDSGSKEDLSDEDAMAVLRKEAKKRSEASELYSKAGDKAREENEKYEKEIIDKYLPKMMSEEEVAKLVEESISELEEVNVKMLGKVISDVKSRSKGLADGALIAKLAKEKMSK
ncbi:MAG TPA: GatB/YqeY domain-containing protein [Candidatus Saccharimonadales bacterium]|nr:GatB/YqeY domain-containing protein [Candidatus Saccharimonadales bacterium]